MASNNHLTPQSDSLFDGTVNPEFLTSGEPRCHNALIDDLPQFGRRLTLSDYADDDDEEQVREIWEPNSDSISKNISAIRRDLHLLADSIMTTNIDANPATGLDALNDLHSFLDHNFTSVGRRFDEINSRLDKLANRNDDLLELTKTTVVAISKQQVDIDNLTRLIKSQIALSMSPTFKPPAADHDLVHGTYN